MVPKCDGHAKMKITDLLNEAAAPKVGRKYQHIEDLILSNGSHGGLHAIERLNHMITQAGTIELKWDGMPVMYWGRDDKGVFGMYPKNAWQYVKSGKLQTSSGASTVMTSPKDVMNFVLGTGSASSAQEIKAREAFGTGLAKLWPYFEKISPKKGYFEGGLLFYPGCDSPPVANPKTGTYDFTPNITTFHVPIDSDLGKKIKTAKMMVAVTGYYDSLGSGDESRYPNAEKLSVPGIIVQGTTYVQEAPNIDTVGLSKLRSFIMQNARKIDTFLEPRSGLSNPGGILYTYLNTHLRTTGLLKDFPDWAHSKLSAGQAAAMLADPEGLKATLGAVEALSNEKLKLINALSAGTHGGIKQTKPEGYVQAHPGGKFQNDIPGQFVKTIDQMNWKPRKL